MSNSGVGTKFVSVNLNKSYGQPPPPHNHSSNASAYGANRIRPSSHIGGGGMVVLSRPRSSQKAGPKLSVPAPLNLPSLRKEHEKFDSLGSGAGISGVGASGSGQRPTSAGMGWIKPVSSAIQEKEEFKSLVPDGIDQVSLGVDGASRVSSVYLPPSARPGLARPSVSSTSSQVNPMPAKVTVLKGEDFPSLQAVLPSGTSQKQKDGLNPKQKHVSEDLYTEKTDTSQLHMHTDMAPQLNLSRQNVVNGIDEKNVGSYTLGVSRPSHQAKKQEYFPGPLPLVSLNARSDWADDERDTSHGLTGRGKDYNFSRKDAYWDQDFDMPRVNALPHKPFYGYSERKGLHDNETGKVLSSEVLKVNPYSRDIKSPSREGREGNFWRNSPLPKDGFRNAAFISDRNDVSTKRSGLNWEKNNEKKHTLPFRENANNDFGRKDTGYGQVGLKNWNNQIDSHNGTERILRDRYVSEQHNGYRNEALLNTSSMKFSYSASAKGIPADDPGLNFGRDKRPFSKSEKNYYEDPFTKEFGTTAFDGRDSFTGGLLGVIKRKKDVVKQTDFHDPVRESFEAELERVQRMQEQERQQIIEEQERSLEIARREEEERVRLIREHEESQRRLEVEAREAAWRAEQERQDAVRRAEEQRIAREEEKRNILMEEERRKQAAKQKLLELEERMARRQAETVKLDTTSVVTELKAAGKVTETDVSRVADIRDWDESERKVKTITSSAFPRTSEMASSRSYFHRDGSSDFMDRGKPLSTRGRDIYETGSSSNFFVQDPDNDHQKREDPSARTFARKESHGGVEFHSPRISNRGWISEPHTDDYIKEQRSNLNGDGEKFISNIEIDSEFDDNIDDFRWGPDNTHGNLTQSHEQTYSNTEANGTFSFGRSRHSVRQPRVLPPPSVASMQKSFYKGESERPYLVGVAEREMGHSNQARNEPIQGRGYSGGHEENPVQSDIVNDQPESAESEKERPNSNSTLRCDSQSTLSVSSPPSSPTHLSHDDLDTSHSPVLSATIRGANIPATIQDSRSVFLPEKEGRDNAESTSIESAVDEDEWAVENNGLQEQEEYDEDEDGYEEEDEAHEGDDENIDFIQDLEGLHLEETESSHLMDNFVLGFNEGVEVGMPSGEFERVSRKEESILGKPQIQSHILEEHGSFNRLHGDGQICEATNDSSQGGTDSTSRMFDKTQKVMQEIFSQSIDLPQTSATSEGLDQVNASHSSSLSLSSSIIVESLSSGCVSNVSAFPSQGEAPIQLQFGLFSGPSLIPSQLPAIQIGSIQMPLPLHPQINPSMTQISQSQPPLFQFGQLRYPSPPLGLRPLAPHSMPFLQSNFQAGFPLTQNFGDALSAPPTGETYAPSLRKSDLRLHSMDSQQGLVSNPLDISQNNLPRKPNTLLPRVNNKHSLSNEQVLAAKSDIIVDNTRSDPAFPQDFKHQVPGLNNHNVLPSGKKLEDQPHTEAGPYESGANKKASSGPNFYGRVSNGRGKRHVFGIKHSGSKSMVSASEDSHLDSSGPIGYQRGPRRQRMEFRVREMPDKRQSNALVSSNHLAQSDTSNVTAPSARNGSGKVGLSNKLVKQISESENLSSGVVDFLELDASKRGDKGNRKENFSKTQNIPPSGEGKLKRNLYTEDNMDGPLQSGVVRIFEQPGIEIPSDEDDFIEVRSKRQMLNDRREQREKESRAKSHVSKIFSKPRSASKISIASTNFNKFSAEKIGETSKQTRPNITTDTHRVRYSEESSSFNSAPASQPLAPIGTPALKTESRSQTIRPLQSRAPFGGGGKQLGPGLIFESKNSVLDSIHMPMDSWGNLPINQQVISLTQMQLDEAMKPAQFESHPPIGIPTSSVSDSNMPASSIMTKDKTFHSIVSPISSLFSGEKIQFGAVTSPTILPPSSRVISNRIGPPFQACGDNQVSKELSGSENGCSLLFHKEKLPSESCTHMEDSESEAGAAASAIAVAAISSDEIVGDRLSSCSISHSKTFSATNIDEITADSDDDRKLGSQSGTDEHLTVTLPADLSIDTPSISLWPPLTSPHNSSGQLLSQFSGGSPHFPFYEMNPLLGGPVFTFGPHDEPISTTQIQSQKSNPTALGPLGTWQQCHSGNDPFYGPPASFAGSFIGPHGGIRGVQGPPHMVVYNHFAPVGQFGQVGLSFMGAYIAPGKQPDWKHDPASSALGDVNNLNFVPGQRNPAPVQHFATSSPLLPMASPMAVFDVSPFQSSLDMSGQAGWPQHVPASSISMPQQSEGGSSANRFPEPAISAVPDQLVKVVHLPDELGIIVDASTDPNNRDELDRKINGQNTNASLKAQSTQHKTSSSQHYNHSSGYGHHREWARPRPGVQRRNALSGTEKNFPATKVKQIYVAKQPTSAKPAVS